MKVYGCIGSMMRGNQGKLTFGGLMSSKMLYHILLLLLFGLVSPLSLPPSLSSLPSLLFFLVQSVDTRYCCNFFFLVYYYYILQGWV
ncbi:uncharacterized protein BO88DRAFT_183195 [Aspergillus vadensis CBS 113365]|uniref:Uncharacterized protein n=1 Tax=Aspergillus vadensis (strain CBS 113365 / IMI 142717 / IBT 24658) TaxID=1448311 RepID=A0A319AUW7_ASPVC|nr:hypothetical protein BO88DRAFT_183195 [Aspergillus vadensis CBS 113365]PYH64157.1 hypothetical protein BO88DRAFT_183195 [Aspergillus vadensis CBS 113365]